MNAEHGALARVGRFGYFSDPVMTLIPKTTVALGILVLVVPGAIAAPLELAPSQDARILRLGGYGDANFATDILSVYTFQDNIQRSLIQFDLSQVGLTPGMRVGSAQLVLTASTSYGPSNGKPMEAYRVTREWAETGLTWNRADVGEPWSVPGGDYAGVVSGSADSPWAVNTSSPATGEVVTWDVTRLVDLWLEGMAPNYGLLLTSSEGNYLVFQQRESPTIHQRPVLRVELESGPPRLRFERLPNSGGLRLSWRGVGAAVLQERSELNPASAWTDSSLGTVIEGGMSIVEVPPGTASRLYRLRSP